MDTNQTFCSANHSSAYPDSMTTSQHHATYRRACCTKCCMAALNLTCVTCAYRAPVPPPMQGLASYIDNLSSKIWPIHLTLPAAPHIKHTSCRRRTSINHFALRCLLHQGKLCHPTSRTEKVKKITDTHLSAVDSLSLLSLVNQPIARVKAHAT